MRYNRVGCHLWVEVAPLQSLRTRRTARVCVLLQKLTGGHNALKLCSEMNNLDFFSDIPSASLSVMYVHKLAPSPELGGGSVRQSQWQTNCCEGCFHSHLNAVAVIVAVVSNPRRNLGVSPIRPDHCSEEYTGKRYPTSRWRLTPSPFPCPNLLQFKCQFLSSASCSDQPFRVRSRAVD